MGFGQELANIVTLLIAMYGLIQGGILLSGLMCVCHCLIYWLSRYTRIDEPDPTMWIRPWERLFNRQFHSIGQMVTQENWAPRTNGIAYQLAIGIVAVFVTLGLYFILSGATLGVMVISYYSMGSVPNLSPLIEQIAAGCLLFALAVIWHSTTLNIDRITQAKQVG